ncbi:hypothetical protein CMK11_10020 [Candidatus Poribacteria bacterium]|nr:hypothetical protein [Candidatus Poribacteria bacterium]
MATDYGFRYDPMEWVEGSDSLQAALVRRHVFHAPHAGDAAMFRARVEVILAEQREDGSLGEPGHNKAARLMELADLGVDPDRPEVARAIAAAVRGTNETPGPWIRDIRALCMLGAGGRPEVKAALELVVAKEAEWNGAWKLCPWGQAFYLRALWAARDVHDTHALMGSILTWMADGLSDAGCIGYKDPWGLIWAAGIIDLPEAKRLVDLLIPTILRGQESDGGWGDDPYDAWSKNSLKVFQALVTHGLLDELRGRPPLPSDWEIVRELTAPDGDLSGLTYDGERLWVMDRDKNEAIAVSPTDGSVQQRLPIPVEEPQGIGWWDDGLAVTREDPKRVVVLDAATGDVKRELPIDAVEWMGGLAQANDELWVSDGFAGGVWRYSDDRPEEPRMLVLAGPAPGALTPASDGVWHSDGFAPFIIKTGFEGELRDWGERPFGGRCEALAWDGTELWALDATDKRICAIRKARPA